MTSLRDQIYEYFFLKEANSDIYFSEYVYIPKGARGVFGGQVISQALAAATLTANTRFIVHSLHSYFILNGRPDDPIYYHVERIRDGKSFCTRNVLAKQRGNTIFSLSCSFKVAEPSHMEHQFDPPSIHSPEESFKFYENHRTQAVTGETRALKFRDKVQVGKLSMDICQAIPKCERLRRSFDLIKSETISKRGESSSAYLESEIALPYNAWWYKLDHELHGLYPQVHMCLFAYISDHRLLSVCNLPHYFGNNIGKNRLTMIASLDHAIWFHAPLRVDRWLLYSLESPRVKDFRGLAYGKVFDENGVLVANVVQEGILRAKQTDPSAAPTEALHFQTFPPEIQPDKASNFQASKL
ncbi:hypothetical protein BB560_000116 [Smittium megazygosporum]|uniref:Acyl-CoA thioesterase II domain-containing protein n=1 Tax=Smittium megazygosporum TaxID=133381 RepID=A0A2T9ZLA0_9FUNG|nr:hypothetical protein BB560_000116 [Smittium megazygosporum]